MKRIILPVLIPMLALALISSCTKETEKSTFEEGYKPVYISKEKAYEVKVGSPTTFTEPGKMFLYQNYIYVTDYGYGVHIIDNTNDSFPTKVAFISIPGVEDAAVKSGILYADNFTDLVAFDVSDVNKIQYKTRVKDIYPLENQLYPNFATGYFECADTTKGYVLRWEKTTLENPKCYR